MDVCVRREGLWRGQNSDGVKHLMPTPIAPFEHAFRAQLQAA